MPRDRLDDRGLTSPNPRVGRGAGLLAFGLLGTSMVMPSTVGLLSVDLSADLGFGDSELGLVISAFWLVTAMTAPLLGRWVDREGWPIGARLGAAAVGLCGLACVLLVDSWVALLAVLALSGIGYSLCSPTSNILVMTAVPSRRQASTLGFKQTAPPLLMALAGVVLPMIANSHGWRPAMAVGMVLPLVVLLVVLLGVRGLREAGASRTGQRDRDRSTPVPLRSLPLVVAAGLGTLSVATITGFAVITLVSVGMSTVAAAGVVSGGSLLAVVARLASGWFLDARPVEDLTPLLAVMGLAALALGLVALGVLGGAAGSPGQGGWRHLVAAGVVLSLVAAWTWPALLLLMVVRRSAGAGAASGLLQLGSGLGSAVGPMGFGLLSAAGGRGWAWSVMALSTLGAMVLVRRGGRPAAVRPGRTG